MKKTLLLINLLILILLTNGCFQSNSKDQNAQEPSANPVVSELKLTSPAFEDGQIIPTKYTCDNANINPTLIIDHAPAGTKSLALIVDDSDAKGFIHWLIWNIDPSTITITEHFVSANSTQGKNDFGNIGYGGPCPPAGQHLYRFNLFALSEKLNLPKGASSAELKNAMKNLILDKAILTGLFR